MKFALPAAAAVAVLALGAWGVTTFMGEDEVATTAKDAKGAVKDAKKTATNTGNNNTAATSPRTDQTAATVPATTPITAPPTTAPPVTAPPTSQPAVAPAPPVTVAGVAVENTEQRSVYRDGRIFLEGKVQNQTLADEYYGRAVAVLGAANVVNNYVIDPSVQIGYSGTVEVEIPFVFQTGSTAISPAYDKDLNVAAAGMSANPSTRMIIVGHTDNVGDPAANLDLSRRRAEAVRDYISKKGGIDPSRFDVSGAGDTQPVADNATDAGRAANRRIVVKITNILV